MPQQQQRADDPVAKQQQMSSSQPGEPSGDAKPQQMGEGSYEGARDYKERTERFVKTHDVDAEAEKAKPQSEQEAREMREAEDEGRSHSKGE